MSSYVFLTSEFPPTADANGICVYNLCRALIEKGNTVYCVCEGKKNGHRILDGIKIYEIEPTFFKAYRNKANATRKKSDYIKVLIIKVLRRIFKAFTFITFPNVSPTRTEKMYKILERINKIESVDFVVGAFRPYECIGSIVKFKKKHPDVTSVPVYLDLIRPRNPFGKFFSFIFLSLCKKNEKKVFTICDRILIPKSGKKTYLSTDFDFAKDKIQFFDFPVFVKQDSNSSIVPELNDDVINIISIGTIDGENRNISYFMDLIERIQKNCGKKIKVHFLGRFSDVKMIEKYKNSETVTFYGNVSPQKVSQFIKSSNYLVNFGNKLTYDMVPSKIFQYFASCKPIINMVAHENDDSLKFFNKYPQVCIISEYEMNTSLDEKKLGTYILSSDLECPSYSEMEEIYVSSKPDYFVKKFLE